jgi:hypothetical protein
VAEAPDGTLILNMTPSSSPHFPHFPPFFRQRGTGGGSARRHFDSQYARQPVWGQLPARLAFQGWRHHMVSCLRWWWRQGAFPYRKATQEGTACG